MSRRRSSVYGRSPVSLAKLQMAARGGHPMLLLVGDTRKAPAAASPTDAGRAELFKTFAAWSGTFKGDGAKGIGHIDASWNRSWTGTDLVRSVEMDGKKMTNIFTTKSVMSL